ncbi:probable cytochrome P450 28a5 isoform X2 [Stomoxys calcitrans]|nr:probable cytochrome P450 28a5 isoform X2 [Stomoxys calcitrans]
MITDAELIHHILVKDFKHFHDNEISTMADEKSDYIYGNHPLALTGDDWYERRSDIKPGLALPRMKLSFSVISKISHNLVEYIEKQQTYGDQEGIDALDLSLRFISEVVGDCILGQRVEIFTQKTHPAVKNAKQLSKQSFIFVIYMILVGLAPSLKKIKKFRFLSRSLEKFFIGQIRNAFKEKTGNGPIGNCNDFLSYLRQLQKKKGLREDEVLTHATTVLLDSYMSIPAVLAHCLLMLGRDSLRQHALRSEITKKLGEVIDIDVIAKMDYLDACIYETIRVFPPTSFMTKVCTKSTELTNKNGQILKIAVGTPVILPIHAVLNDGQYYENPTKFQPERFLQGKLQKFRETGLYLAFGDGPRACFGEHFALIQIKRALIEVIRSYEVSINPKTRSDNIFNPMTMLSQLNGGIWLNFKKQS